MIPDLHLYTGKWFCYINLVISYYLLLYIGGHSAIIALMKYIIIVYDGKVRVFGREKIIEIFFWINFIHPIIAIALSLILRPDFLLAYGGWKQINSCLGNTGNTNRLLSLCDFTKPLHPHSFEYTLYILRRVICVLQVLIIYFLSWNLFDVLFYCLIFAYARR